MTPDGEPKSLSEITKDMGLNMSDVAAFSGLDESTVFRLWDNVEWLDRVSGRSLQSLMSSIPGIAEYSQAHSVRKRRDVLLGHLRAEGLIVDLEALENSPVPQPHLLNALEAALCIVRGEPTQKTSSFIARFWGREQDRALELVYSDEPGRGILRDPQILRESSIDLAPRLNRKTYSFHSILAVNVISHQVSKVSDGIEADLGTEGPARQTAFTTRGVVMGSLISSNDIELAEKYHRELMATPVYRALEEWAFPTYTRDGRLSSDFTLPSSLSLRNTATEVLREIAVYNDAYFYYLVSTYIPLALNRDLAFGGRLAELIQALELRGIDCQDRRIRQTCNTLVRRLKSIV
ncbi:hypothetical protein BZB76_2465 [Actinomadura pelletieri DSM 43383]|uniref:Uncharacterized protein n=1 Tax=Actinomadura pelletieri DSM 43383 TaxID=1120940 RepID=A0A495QUJ9_9ACTN|nr:hypothetical protein [Actinomadura pelletieri]RKS77093.1 hypothetical protein BZB76_2465 [Actinomadura pelletieri DSM 43383]